MPDIDPQSTAASRYFAMVRAYVVRRKPWEDAIRYQSKPDETYDLTLTALRVYGSRDEWLTVQAAAGLDSPEYPLTEQLLVLPTPDQVDYMKARAGLVTDAEARKLGGIE